MNRHFRCCALLGLGKNEFQTRYLIRIYFEIRIQFRNVLYDSESIYHLGSWSEENTFFMAFKFASSKRYININPGQ